MSDERQPGTELFDSATAIYPAPLRTWVTGEITSQTAWRSGRQEGRHLKIYFSRWSSRITHRLPGPGGALASGAIPHRRALHSGSDGGHATEATRCTDPVTGATAPARSAAEQQQGAVPGSCSVAAASCGVIPLCSQKACHAGMPNPEGAIRSDHPDDVRHKMVVPMFGVR